MSEAFVELLFWIVVFVVFFFGFKRLQNRKKERQAEASKQTHRHPESNDASDANDGGGSD
ncbi:MAG: hypothetical protein AB8B62_02100 [Roseobacter sp.]